MLHDKKLNYSQRYNKKKYSNKPVYRGWKMKRKSRWTAAWISGHYVLRGKIEPLFKPTEFWHSIIMYLLFNFIKFLGFLTVFFDISMRGSAIHFYHNAVITKLNFKLFYTELSCLWRTLLQFISAVYLHLILSLTSDTNQSWLQVKSFRIGSNHNNQSRSKPAYNEIHCLGLNIELTCV